VSALKIWPNGRSRVSYRKDFSTSAGETYCGSPAATPSWPGVEGGALSSQATPGH